MSIEIKECAICLEDMKEEKSLECGHYIHKACFKKQIKSECPVCRRPYPITKRICFSRRVCIICRGAFCTVLLFGCCASAGYLCYIVTQNMI